VQGIIEMKLTIAILSVLAGGAVAQFTLLDGLVGVVAPLLYETDTAYAEGYSDSGFRAISVGMTGTQASDLLGEPLHEVWEYRSVAEKCGYVRVEADVVLLSTEKPGCPLQPVSPGMSKAELTRLRGVPSIERRLYSLSPSGKSYRERIVVLVHRTVTERISSFYID
jgi:hypothetical protein